MNPASAVRSAFCNSGTQDLWVCLSHGHSGAGSIVPAPGPSVCPLCISTQDVRVPVCMGSVTETLAE